MRPTLLLHRRFPIPPWPVSVILIRGGMLLWIVAAFGCQRAGSAADPASAAVGVVDTGAIVKELRLSAPVRNDDSVDVFSLVEGPVAELYVEAGQMVKAGDPLIKIDDEEARAEVRKAALELEDARCAAALEPESQEPAGRRRKEIAVEIAEIEHARAERTLARHVVRAPRDGKIYKVDVAAGDFVAVKAAFSQGTKIASIVGDNVYKLQIVAGERDVPRIRLRQPAKVLIDAIPGLEASGEVVAIETNPEPGMATPSFPVAVRFRTISPEVKLGMTGSVILRLAEVKSCLRVPVQAIRLVDDRPFVLLLDADGRERRCDVKLGIDDGEKIEVSGDLQPGDRVVLLGT